jgi:hypothetical protein
VIRKAALNSKGRVAFGAALLTLLLAGGMSYRAVLQELQNLLLALERLGRLVLDEFTRAKVLSASAAQVVRRIWALEATQFVALQTTSRAEWGTVPTALTMAWYFGRLSPDLPTTIARFPSDRRMNSVLTRRRGKSRLRVFLRRSAITKILNVEDERVAPLPGHG